MTSHWEAYHARWSRLRPPLRPAPEVVAALSEELAAFPAAREPERACLLLGVTPELATIHTPLVAVDRNHAMIDALWIGNDAERRAVRADWTELDPSIGPLGCAVGDGSLNVMASPHPQIQVLKRLRELIPKHGGVVLRCFVRSPAEIDGAMNAVTPNAETPEQVCDTPELSASFHGFKWRLAMALCNERGSTLQVAALWGKFHRTFPDRAALAERTGWSLEDIQTIDVYADSRETYSFP
ncbi:MAG: hypothetical protein KC492_42080, partial [Myxococcales bacterium]|nr:hypothetical protein [Myxococcales bacterium]